MPSHVCKTESLTIGDLTVSMTALEQVKTEDLQAIQKMPAFTELDAACQAIVAEELERRKNTGLVATVTRVPMKVGDTLKSGIVAVGEFLPATILGLTALGAGAYYVFHGR